MPLITQGKTNWKFLLIVIILAIVAGVLALRCSFKEEQLYQPPKIEKSETADWKTYRNEEYSFEIKYPQKWGLEVLSSVPSPYIEGIDIIQPYNEIYKSGSFVGKDLNFLIISSSFVNLDNIIKDTKAEEIDLGNALAWRYKRQIEGPETMVLTEEVTLIPDKDFYIEISELANYGSEDYNFRSRTISTILSTFKFTD